MNSSDKLRRNLHEAFGPGPKPSPSLMPRIMASLSGPTRSDRYRSPRRLPTLALVIVVLIVVDALIVARVQDLNGAGRLRVLALDNVGWVEFLSSQAQPAAEYRAMTNSVLAGFNGTVDFNSQPSAAQEVRRISADKYKERGAVDLIALTHSDMLTLEGNDTLEDLTPLLNRLRKDRRLPDNLVEYGQFGTGKQYYIPWLQATYMLAVNKKALAYLPAGIDDWNNLTYDQLIAWGENIQQKTGQKMIGLPMDLNTIRGGLVYRFLQGYTYPSYTGSTLVGFKSPEAVEMWEMLRRLWSVTNPNSIGYNYMQNPLETGEVWIGWDHQARLKDILERPDFIAIPAPRGPRGLGYMSVTVGLAIPKNAPNRAGAEALIDWLTRPKQQAAAGSSLNFIPVLPDAREVAKKQSPALYAEIGVANRYRDSAVGIEAVPPAGLGASIDQFTHIYQETFRQIVLDNQPIRSVLDNSADALQATVGEAGARCWPPDRQVDDPCRIDGVKN